MGFTDQESYEILISILLTDRCNFNCSYCSQKSHTHKIQRWIKSNLFITKKISPSDIIKISTKIKNIKKRCLISISGGEPFMFPKFIEFCLQLTKHNQIYVSTNLSHKKVYDFAEKINPSRVNAISASLHIQELEKYNLIEDFITKIGYLNQKGFKTKVKYVMYPPLVERFEKDYDYFKKKGIVIIPKLFVGDYKSKRYPLSYTSKQKKILLKYIDEKYKKLLYFDSNYKNKMCLAGKGLISITSDGFIYRCWGEKKAGLKPLGNIIKGKISLFDKAKPCKVSNCPCLADGLEYVTNS